ncbi:cyclic pyranopterin monophosphate synthase MoaC [Kordiimonas sp.]|uniref:cyclic pyranopterin monophosphate synthase MoaC n=1 Tax=Kordiimonas sp. TaxID=1970157 RepID=UPI003A90B932
MGKLSHVDEKGAVHMVDVGSKDVSARAATAQAIVKAQSGTIDLIFEGKLPKGDVIATAKLAGIMAAKKTSDLIPLCHPLPITSANMEIERLDAERISILATVKVSGKTGVEMEALTAASVAALTLYDMAKAVDKGICIQETKLLMKEGGKSGRYKAP